MRPLVALLVLALVPVVLAVSLVGFVVGSMRYHAGGVPGYVLRPWIHFHEICITGWLRSTWLKLWVAELKGYLSWSDRAVQHSKPIFFLTRFILRHSDPVTGPLQALWYGVFTLPLLVWLVGWLGIPQHISAANPQGSLAVAWAWLVQVQPDRTIWQWLALFLLVIFILHAHNEIRQRCVMQTGIRAQLELIDVLEKGTASLVRQDYPPTLWPPHMFDTPFARSMHKNTLHNTYGKKFETPPDYLASGEENSNQVLDVRYLKPLEEKVLLASSYCLMNLAGSNHVVLNRRHDFRKVWDKFTLLHEFGHLKGSGMRASLIETGGRGLYLLPVMSIPFLVWGFNTHAAVYAANLTAYAAFYVVFVWWKWMIWESNASAEMAADLFAFSSLDPAEIPPALKLRLHGLKREINAKRREKHFNAAERCHLLGLKCRYRLLSSYGERFGNNPVYWDRKFQIPPMQGRVFAAIASTFCLFSVFAGTVSFWVTGGMWVIAVFMRTANTALYAQFHEVDKRMGSFYQSTLYRDS